MRRILLPAALILAMAAAAPAYASAGLPKLMSLQAGSYAATLSGDSPSAHTGANVLTLAIFDLPEGAKVSLELTGPAGQVVSVPLQPLRIVEGPADGLGEAAADDHGATDAGGHGGDEHAQPASYNARGKAELASTGTWTAVLKIEDAQGRTHEARGTFDAVKGGPSRFYLGFTGLLMGASVTYGAVVRIQNKRNGGAR